VVSYGERGSDEGIGASIHLHSIMDLAQGQAAIGLTVEGNEIRLPLGDRERVGGIGIHSAIIFTSILFFLLPSNSP